MLLSLFSKWRFSRWQRFALAIALPILAISLNFLLSEDFSKALILMPVGAVMAVSLVGGFWPGLVSIILCGIGLAWLVLEPVGIAIFWPTGYLDELIFLAVSLAGWSAAVGLRSEVAKVRERDEAMLGAAHDLRSPLTALVLTVEGLGFIADSLPASDQEMQLRSAVSRLRRQLYQMRDLIDGLFTIARSHADRDENSDLADVVREVLDEMSSEIQRAACSVDLEAEPVVGPWSRLGIRRIVSNLLANAIKHAPSSPISLRVHRDGGYALLEVADRGPGIEPRTFSQIFERYARGKVQRGDGGSGLGLYIVRQIVEAHQGKTAVYARPGEGSRFVVKLPI